MPEVRIIDVSQWLIQNTPELKTEIASVSVPCTSGLQLGSRYAADPLQTTIFDYLPESILGRIANLQDFPRVLAFDKWTGNSDGRQAVFFKEWNQRQYRVTFIDQGYCFNAGEWDFPDAPLRGTFALNSVYASVTGWESFEPILSRIEAIVPADIWKIAREIPPEWYQHNTEALSQLIRSLHVRAPMVRDLITSFRNSTRNPFPNWLAQQHRRPGSTQTPTKEEESKVPESTLKSAFTFDLETQTFKPAVHNLSAGQAIEQFSTDTSVKIVDQEARHRHSDATKCQACKKTAQELTRKHVQPPSGLEGEEEEADPEERERD